MFDGFIREAAPAHIQSKSLRLVLSGCYRMATRRRALALLPTFTCDARILEKVFRLA
jgi:hypothetical protein